jgi:hypothetical protein
MGIQPADFAGKRLKLYSILSATVSCKGPLPLYEGHRVTESVLIGIFRVAQ